MTAVRNTKYSLAVTQYIKLVGHATNAQILQHLQKTYPKLSATTVHRITSGMHERGQLALAPPAPDNSTRFDANLNGHDHFECKNCGCLRDLHLPARLLQSLQTTLGECQFSGHLNIQGICNKCLENKEK